jgi:hypothetical protein
MSVAILVIFASASLGKSDSEANTKTSNPPRLVGATGWWRGGDIALGGLPQRQTRCRLEHANYGGRSQPGTDTPFG